MPPRANDSGPTQVSQMPADLGLVGLQDLDEEADTHLVAAHEIKEPQPRAICQGAEESLFGESDRFAHDVGILPRMTIYGLTYI